MAFRVGQKVVCIKNSVRVINDLGYPPFKKGEILTVFSIDEDAHYGTFLRFYERSPQQQGHVDGFRPLVERKTDTGFAILEEIRRRETLPADKPRVTAPASLSGGPS